jgi:hypothetical protein
LAEIGDFHEPKGAILAIESYIHYSRNIKYPKTVHVQRIYPMRSHGISGSKENSQSHARNLKTQKESWATYQRERYTEAKLSMRNA